jgi:hypothetical protein
MQKYMRKEQKTILHNVVADHFNTIWEEKNEELMWRKAEDNYYKEQAVVSENN